MVRSTLAWTMAAAVLTASAAPLAAQCSVASLFAADGQAQDGFGSVVSLSGDTALIGAPREGGGPLFDAGSAYVFEVQGSAWVQVAKLIGADAKPLDAFGSAVALAGNDALIGAPMTDDLGPVTGSVYVFRREGAVWVQKQKLTASDGDDGDRLGLSLAASGDVAVAGALDDRLGNNAGGVYVFERQGGVWIETAILLAADGADSDFLSGDVAIDGTRVVVGANGDDDAGELSGSVYVFEKQLDGTWLQTAKLTASDGAPFDRFGSAVAVDGGVIAVGASVGVGTGKAYVFEQSDGVWVETAALTAPAVAGTNAFVFGWDVAVEGDRLLVSDYFDSVSGSVYVYERGPSGWAFASHLVSADTGFGISFGVDVALTARRALFGSPGLDGVAASSGGAEVWSFAPPECALEADAFLLSAAAGGSVDFALQAGAAHAGLVYLLLGTSGGTAPGFPLDGLQVPLNHDGPNGYLAFTLVEAGGPQLPGTLGALDALGEAAVQLVLAPGLVAPAMGLTLHHAFLVFDLDAVLGQGSKAAVLASNAVGIVLVP